MPGGQRQLVPVFNAVGGFPVTDDLGQYRVYGLIPGTYLLSAGSSTGAMSVMTPEGGMTTVSENEGYAMTYYPGTLNVDDAQAITVALAQEVFADFALVPARLSKVSGIVRNSQGRAAAGVNVMLRGASIIGMMNGPSFARTGSDGSFTLAKVAPCECVMEVRPTSSGDQEFASMPVTVSGQDITGLIITTGPGAVIAGRIAFDATKPRPTTPALRVTAESADPMQGVITNATADSGLVDEQGIFKIVGISGKVLFRLSPLPTGWSLRSVRFDGHDITDIPLEVTTNIAGLEIVLTDQQSTFSGTVRDVRGETVEDYIVVLLPRNLADGIVLNRFVATLRPDQDGRFEMRGVVPGDYFAVALESLESGDEWDPAIQKQLRDHAKEFTIKEGQALSVELVLQR
jgi:hypothetical protein